MARDPLVQDRKPLNEAKYAGRDYQSIFDALMRRLKVEYADVYNDYAASSVGIMLVDLCADAAGKLSWYLDRLVSDCYLATVRTPTAASRLTRQLGYKMNPAAAASADLTLTFPNGIAGPCQMAQGWRFQGPSGIQFESVADLTLGVTAHGGTATLAVRQGETRQLSFVGDGTPFQQFRLEYSGDGKTIADQSVRVWVDGAEWAEEPLLSSELTAQFEVDYHANPPLLRFGDGRTAGLVPNDGADIRVQFIKIVGAQGNVLSGTITTSLDTLTVGGSTVLFTVTNAVGASSGRDAEAIDHAQRWAPFTFAARDGAVTGTDYQALSNSFVDPLYGAVAKAYAHTPRDQYADPVFNNYINAIYAAADALLVAMTSAAAAIAASTTAITAQVQAIDDQGAAIEVLRGEILNMAQGAAYGCTTVLTALQANQGTLTAMQGTIVTVQDYVDTHVTDPTDKATILAYLDQIDTLRSTLASAETGIGTTVNTLIEANVYGMQAKLVTGQAANIEDALADQAAASALIAPQVTNIDVQVLSINQSIVNINSVIDLQLPFIQERIGLLFDASCRSNVVQVPILSTNPDGDYVAPPSGLMIQLQNYLMGKSETTQFVEVVDGSLGLIAADVLVEYKVLDGYVGAEVRAAIDATIRGLLRGRDYDAPLYLSDVYRYVRACATGISHVTITLSSPTVGIKDAYGNLVPAAMQVLTLGTLTMVEII